MISGASVVIGALASAFLLMTAIAMRGWWLVRELRPHCPDCGERLIGEY